MDDFNEIYQPMVAIIITWSLATICATLLMVSVEIVQYLSSANEVLFFNNFNFKFNEIF